MSQYSPTVLPTWGQSLGNALGAGVGAYVQGRRQKIEDESEMFGHGLMPVDPNAPKAPLPTIQPGPDVAEQHTGYSGPDLADALAAPSPFKGRGAVPSMGEPSAIEPQRVAAALAPQAPSPYDAPIHLLGRDWQMTPQAKASMALANALKSADVNSKIAEAYKNTREAGASRPGDANYASVMGDKARAEALATLPVKMQELVTQGRISLENALAVGRQRGGIESALQANRQQFEQGQQGRQQSFEAGQTKTKLGGALTNSITEERNKEGGEVMPSLVRGARAGLNWIGNLGSPESQPNAPTSTGGASNLPPLTAAQQARAASDPDYRAFLKTKGYP